MKMAVVFGLALVNAGCGRSAVQPADCTEQRMTPTRPRELPSVMIVVNPEASPHAERWASPARLVNQKASNSDRACNREEDHDRVLSFGFDGAGLRFVLRRAHAVSVWAREPNATDWKQVLREPWQSSRVGWKKDYLTLCTQKPRGGVDALFAPDPTGVIKVSLGQGPAEWMETANERCMSETASAPQKSSDGRWRAVETVRNEPNCRPTMPDGTGRRTDCKRIWEYTITGPGSAPKTLVGSGGTPAMSPSGRFFAFQEPSLAVTVYDTTTRNSRPTGAVLRQGTYPELLGLNWLPDESAFSILLEDGGVSFVATETGKVTSATAGKGWSSGYLVLDPSTGAPLVRKDWRCGAPVVAPRLSVTLPGKADRTLSLPAARRTTAFGNGTLALWEEDTGKVLRIIGGVVSFEPSPSERFIAVLLDRCGKTLGCGGAVEVVDTVSGTTRWTLELPAVTTSSVVQWFGPASREILAVVEKSAQFLRPSDGAVLHAEPPSASEEVSPVLWTEEGLVDASNAELEAWSFRPAGRLDHVVEATLLHHPNLWNDFREGRPLPPPSALNKGTKGP